jgi:hypothetical protein
VAKPGALPADKLPGVEKDAWGEVVFGHPPIQIFQDLTVADGATGGGILLKAGSAQGCYFIDKSSPQHGADAGPERPIKGLTGAGQEESFF